MFLSLRKVLYLNRYNISLRTHSLKLLNFSFPDFVSLSLCLAAKAQEMNTQASTECVLIIATFSRAVVAKRISINKPKTCTQRWLQGSYFHIHLHKINETCFLLDVFPVLNFRGNETSKRERKEKQVPKEEQYGYL